jgi:hypothetical protein
MMTNHNRIRYFSKMKMSLKAQFVHSKTIENQADLTSSLMTQTTILIVSCEITRTYKSSLFVNIKETYAAD